jgi:hypothetical protein
MRVQGIARYTHLAKPSAPKGSQDLKYSINILIHKNDPQLPNIQAELATTIKNGFPSGMPASAHTCLHDMAIKDPTNTALADYMSLSANTRADMNRPDFVDSNLDMIIDPAADSNTDGMVVYADINFATYDQVAKGVKAYLNAVMVTQQEGAIPRESLSSKPSVKSLFGDLVGTAAAPAVPAF